MAMSLMDRCDQVLDGSPLDATANGAKFLRRLGCSDTIIRLNWTEASHGAAVPCDRQGAARQSR